MNSKLVALVAIIVLVILVLSGILFATANDDIKNERISGILSTVITSDSSSRLTATSKSIKENGTVKVGPSDSGQGGAQSTLRPSSFPGDNQFATKNATVVEIPESTKINLPAATATTDINLPPTATKYTILSPTATKASTPTRTPTDVIFFSPTPTSVVVFSATPTEKQNSTRTPTKNWEIPTSTRIASLTPTARPTLVPTLKPTSTVKPTDKPKCDPSYPTVCIASPPPDLNCKDIPYRNFAVLQPDPHKFDTNKNGIGCERIQKGEFEGSVPPPSK